MKKRSLRIFGLLVIVGAILGYSFLYRPVFAPNVRLNPDEEQREFFVNSGMTYDEVGNQLKEEKIIISATSFHQVARSMNYHNRVIPGRYMIEDGMSNRELIGMLRAGQQAPIQYTFIKFRTLEDIAKHAAERFEFTEGQMMNALNNEEFLDKLGKLKKETVMAIFIPNTYEMWWNTSPEELVRRMYKEYRTFWNDDRNARRKKWRLSRLEIMTLASIVEEESNKNDERGRIAGVYLNRIRKNWRLEADPTLKFAVGDFELRRILNRHKDIDSPYNTYMYEGIPPGPICSPSIPSIEAVLNGERHDYMFFCARADGSGYHQFSETLTEHLNYANAYHARLDQQGIK